MATVAARGLARFSRESVRLLILSQIINRWKFGKTVPVPVSWLFILGTNMAARFRPLILGPVIVAAFIAAIGLSRSATTEMPRPRRCRLRGAMKWYRGNMHTHSHWSDGDDYLEMIALWYREHGYDFLGFTDHNTLANKERWVDIDKTRGGRIAYDKLKARFPSDWIEERTKDEKLEVRLKRFDEVFARFNEKDKFLLIQSEEISDHFGKLPIHLNAHNLVEAIPPIGGASVSESIQNNVNALIAQRERTRQTMMIHLNHPNYGWGITAEDLAPIRGENFFEVYNGHPSVHNAGDATHASTERMWDIINARRLTEFELPLLYGLATDDCHVYHNIPSQGSEPGRGWVMVLSSKLDPTSLIQAMEAGRFYASSGVTLERIVATEKGLEISVRPEDGVEYTIEFMGTRKGFDSKSEPVLDREGHELPVTRTYSSDIGAVLKSETGTSATYTFAGDELYVRARVTSSKAHPNPSAIGEHERAWTQPVRP